MSFFNLRRRVSILPAVGAVCITLLVAGCSYGSSEKVQPGGPAPDSGKQQLQTLKVGIVPVADAGGLFIAEEKGFFQNEGLTVQSQTLTSGAALIPALQSGALDTGMTNLVSVLQAREKGLDVRCLSAVLRKPQEGDNLSLVLSPKVKDSIKSASDLGGKTIAVNSLANINQLVAQTWIDANGGDSKSVNFVALAFPDMPAALTEGRIDAAIADEPFVTLSQQADSAILAPQPYKAIAERPVFSCWVVTSEWIESHQDEARAYIAALQQASSTFQDDPEYLRSILPKYTSMSEELAGEISLPEITTDLTPADYDVWQDAALKYNLIKDRVDTDELDAGLNN